MADVASVLRWLALALPVEALATIHMARKLKDFGHKVVALRIMTSTLIGGSVAIAAALMGAGIWSLILQAWITSLLNAVFAWSSYRWLPELRFSRKFILSVLPFCSSIIATRMLWLFVSRLPEIFIGRALGASAVGQYRVAWRLMELIGQTILHPMGTVAFTALSRLQKDQARIEGAYVRLLGLGALVSFPLLFGVGILADELVRLLFGSQWTGSAEIVKLFPLVTVSMALNYLVIPTLTAKGALKHLTLFAIIQFVMTIVTSWAAAPFGLMAVFVAYLLRVYVMIPYQQYVLYKSTGISFSRCWRAIQIPLLASGSMAGVLLISGPFLRMQLAGDIGFVSVNILLGGIVYIISLSVLGKSFILPYLEVVKPLWQGLFRK
jgi:O-antigen/teichoic acid export membrane protein